MLLCTPLPRLLLSNFVAVAEVDGLAHDVDDIVAQGVDNIVRVVLRILVGFEVIIREGKQV